MQTLVLAVWDFSKPMIGMPAGILLILAVTIAAISWLKKRRLTSLAASMERMSASQQPLVNSERTIERRQFPRRWGSPVMVLVADAMAQAQPVEGIVLNRSAGGLCLSLPKEVEVGTTLSVRVAIAPSSTAWTPVQVKYCLLFAARWKVGCHFKQTVAEDVLLLFG